MTLMDTAADTDYEPGYETKHQRIEAWKGLMSSNRLDDGVCRTFSLRLYSAQQLCSSAFFSPATHGCRRVYFF